MRLATRCSVLLVLVGMTGCIESTTVVKVRPDGSGTIMQTTTMSAQMAATMKKMVADMAKSLGGEKAAPVGDLFPETEARRNALKLGKGVRYVSSERIQTADAEGIRASYAFDDVTKLRIDEKPNAPAAAGAAVPAGGGSENMMFRFSKQANGNSLLTVLIPRDKGKSDAPVPDTGARPGEATPEQLARMKEMFNGLKISIAVEVDGKLVRTNGAYVEGPKVTVFEVDMGQLLSDEAKLMELAKIKTIDQAKEALKGLKGVKVDLGPEIQIEFSGR